MPLSKQRRTLQFQLTPNEDFLRSARETEIVWGRSRLNNCARVAGLRSFGVFSKFFPHCRFARMVFDRTLVCGSGYFFEISEVRS